MQGAKLKSARLAAGLSTRRVAELLPSYGAKVSHATLANYEKGATSPSIDTLVALSELYRRPLQWFVSTKPTMTGMRYRRHKTGIRVAEIARFEVESQRYLEALIALEEALGTCLNSSNRVRLHQASSGKDAGSELRKLLGFSQTQPIDSIFDVLEQMGVLVIDLVADRRIDGLSATLDGWDVVVVNSSKPTSRLRMDAAHELFHLMLGDCDHHDDGIVDSEEERIAMDAASHFLAPDEVVADAFRGKSMVRLVKFKEAYGISLAALVYRAGQLNILNESECKALWIEFAKRGWRKREPGTVRSDSPWRFEFLIDMARHEAQMSWQDLGNLTGLTEHELKTRLDIRYGSPEEGEMPPRKEVESPLNQGLRLVR